MRSYGYIFATSKLAASKRVKKVISKVSKIGDTEVLPFEEVYQQVAWIHLKVYGSEPTENDRAKMDELAQRRFRILTEDIKTEQIRHLVRFSHPAFSSENVARISEQVSHLCPEIGVCSVAGFDESAFQLFVYYPGYTATTHQIGEELDTIGLRQTIGDVKVFSSFFQIPEFVATKFLRIKDVMEAEEYLFGNILSINEPH